MAVLPPVQKVHIKPDATDVHALVTVIEKHAGALRADLERFMPPRPGPGACTAALIYDGPDGEPREVVLDFTDGRREVYPVTGHAALSAARQYRLGARAEANTEG